ncbi:sigma-70 family RNA polymerase sigma factor [Candidatus Dojkabacteria bacterium]|uniref:Sigma-70 family RNA polymerase sigma factor n=1 Tax=Candidatus Dojkabacteria bacterium TaxID=2099670 RepID=A0A955L3I5_9BACT|nr:sigma-70 family RNA polymerase sigma factor [Candidatus Dojkabacteria bacterium]
MNTEEQIKISINHKAYQDAFVIIFEYYYDRIYKFVRWKVSSKENAEDIVSETFYRTLKSLNRFDTSKNFNNWIYTIARNLITDHYRKSNDFNQEIFDVEAEDPDDNLKTIEIRALLKQALSGLDPETKDLVIFKYILGYSVKEISRIVELPEKTVYTKISRSVKKMGKLMNYDTDRN